MPPFDRASEFRAISQERTRAALALERVRRIDSRLTKDWGIEFHRGDLHDLIPTGSPYWAARDAVANALERHADRRTLDQLEARLYDALAAPDVLGPVTSTRRALILDSVALAIALVERLSLSGAILDVGCHVGFVASVLADELPNEVVGIDPSSSAVVAGRKHTSMNARAALHVASLPWNTETRFDFAIAVSSMPDLRGDVGGFLRGLGELLNDGGAALVTSAHWVDADVDRVRVMLKNAKLGFAYADVAGGYEGLPPQFETEGIVVLLKNGNELYPRKVRMLMEAEWNLFRNYANDRTTPLREKTQAFERALRTRRFTR